MAHKVFFIRYLENSAVKVETHFKGENERRRPLADVADLIQAFQQLPNSPLADVFAGDITLKLPDGTQLEPDTLLSNITTGTTAKTALVIITTSPQQQHRSTKFLSSTGPVDIELNFVIPFDSLSWGQELMRAVDSKESILLYGHWQSGKTSALRFIQSRAKQASIKVYYLDMLADVEALKLCSIDNTSLYEYLAGRISNQQPNNITKFTTCVDFSNWINRNHETPPILLIDEYDAFLQVVRMPGGKRMLVEMNQLISYSRNIQDTFQSIVCAGTFSIVATQTQDPQYMAIDDDVNAEEASVSKTNGSEDSLDAVVRPFDVVSPWNKAYFIETKPFERKVFQKFAKDVLNCHNFNSSDDVFVDIFDTTCGHPGFSVWLLRKSIERAVGQECLTVPDWMFSKRFTYNAELYKTPTMTKMVSRLQSSKKITAVLHTLVRDNQVLCPETRLASFLRAIGVAKLMSDRTDWLTFTSPIFRDCLLRQFYPPCDDIIETIDISDSTPLNYMVSVLLKALPYIKAREILDPLVTYTKGLAEAALHAELYRIIHAFFRNQDVSILTETKVVEGSDVRCDLWLRAGLAEFGLELKTERNNGYLQQEANPQILKYASSRKPREMVLLNFVKKEADSITFPINIKPQGWITYPNTKFSVLIVKVMGDVQTGLRFGYALNGDNSWSELTV